MRAFLRGFFTLSELTPEEKLDALYEFLENLPDEIKRSEIYSRFPEMSKYQIDRVLQILRFSDIISIRYSRTFPPYQIIVKTPLAKEIEERGKLTLSDFSEAPEWVRRILKRKPLRIEIYIGDDTSTGYDIYYNYLRKLYLLRDTEGRKVEEFSDLGLIKTFSIDTHGHEELICEIASYTWVRRMHPKYFDRIERRLKTLIRACILINFGINIEEKAIKGGLEYMSETGTYVSEEAYFRAEFPIEKIMWDNAKCIVEHVHERRGFVRKGRAIECTLNKIEEKYPGFIERLEREEIQTVLEEFTLEQKPKKKSIEEGEEFKLRRE